jgi:BirA family transcriptional regulator, biotin operon repressor / biotin---[acetyl-CoA-carboxylase] ligase
MNRPQLPSSKADPGHAPEALLGATLLRFDELASTNDYARQLALQGANQGVAVIARKQTAGRGRQGRKWSSPVDAGLYLSIILRPQAAPAQASLITLASAVAVSETLQLDFAIRADIKWPNDVLLNGRKLCGILVESAIENNRLQYAILGIGVNLGQPAFPDELQQTATSVFLETHREITPDEFLQPLLAHLNHWYVASLEEPQTVISRWQELSSFANDCAVRILSGDTVIEGITRGLTANGTLLVELENGERREIVSGEVSLRRVPGL